MRQLGAARRISPTSPPAAWSSGHAPHIPRAPSRRLASVIDAPMLTRLIPLAKLDDARLAARTGAGDAAAFSALYDRHHASLLAFCRHMLGNRQDGEDALQQTFIRAHRALLRGQLPDEPRAWLFAIARNRCRTMLAARRDTVVDGTEQLERVCVDGLTAEVQQRAELRELLGDMSKLPEDQRAALLLAELRGFSQEQIAHVIGCPTQKVKALVFQARTHLLAEREARDTECIEIRQQLEVARGSELRRGLLRRHLRRCQPCKTYSIAVAAQRNELAGLLAVLPSAGLKLSVLGAGGLVGSDGAAGGAAAAAGMTGGGASAGLAAGGQAGAGGAATAGGMGVSGVGGIATKLAVVKVAAVLAVSGGAAGGTAAIVNGDGHGSEPAAVQPGRGARTHDPSTPGRRAGRHSSAARPGPASTNRPRTGMRPAARAGTRVRSRTRTRIRKLLERRRASKRATTRRKAATRPRGVGPAARTGRERRAKARRQPKPRPAGGTNHRPADAERTGRRKGAGGRTGKGRRQPRVNPPPRRPRRQPPATPAAAQPPPVMPAAAQPPPVTPAAPPTAESPAEPDSTTP